MKIENPINSEVLFTYMVDNAFDFLDKSIKEISSEPKYSIIHFCAAIEIIFKARLLKEHWSLILTEPASASWDKFIKGDFRSTVGVKKAADRLKDIANIDVNADALKSFEDLSTHRNQLIHFFHSNLYVHDSEKAQQNIREQIMAELCKSWFHLHTLLKHNDWNNYFSAYRTKINTTELKMKSFLGYLKPKFEALKPKLDELRTQGKTIIRCDSCEFAAMASDIKLLETQSKKGFELTVVTAQCYVCDHKYQGIKIICPHCKQSTVVDSEDNYCKQEACQLDISASDIQDYLHKMLGTDISYKVTTEYDIPCLCKNCEHEESVFEVAFHQGLCLNCFTVGDIRVCEFCGHSLMGGDDEYGSYSYGCDECEGNYRYQMSRDD